MNGSVCVTDDICTGGGRGPNGVSGKRKVVYIVGVALVIAMVVIGISLALYYRGQDGMRSEE